MAYSDTLYFDGKKVSRAWFIVLSEARRQGVYFHLNQGRRTIAEQWYFYNNQPPLAAYPNQNAPHIKWGQIHHALDVSTPSVYALAAWLRRQGVNPRWTVRGEPWHIEITAAELLRLAKRFQRPPNKYPTLRYRSRGAAVRRLQRRLRVHNADTGKGALPITGYFGDRTRAAVKRFQKRHGLRPDGVVGPRTWRKLRRQPKRK